TRGAYPDPLAPTPTDLPPIPAAGPAFLPSGGSGCCPTEPCVWGSAEFLLWFEKNGPLPVPLVTTNPNPAALGQLGEPGTQVIFGASSGDLDYNPLPGFRLTVGGWCNQCRTIGAEASGFILPTECTNFQASTPGGGGPVIAVPFRDPTTGETALSN